MINPVVGKNGQELSSRTYAELLKDESLSEDQKDRIIADSVLGHVAALLIGRSDIDTAKLILLVQAQLLQWDNEGREKDLILEVAAADRPAFTERALDRLREACGEVDLRLGHGVRWVEVREIIPEVGPGWQGQLRQEIYGERPSNQGRRLQASPPRWVEDSLAFTNSGELHVYKALKHMQEKILPKEETIGIFPLANGRINGHTWEPDMFVTYKGRAGVLEIDGPHHNARRALDTTREHLLRDAGIAFVDRIPVEALRDPEELFSSLQRFLRRLSEHR